MAFIYYVTQIQFDFGAIKLLKQECERVGITRPLIVSDAGVKAAGILQRALDQLPGMTVAVLTKHLQTPLRLQCTRPQPFTKPVTAMD